MTSSICFFGERPHFGAIDEKGANQSSSLSIGTAIEDRAPPYLNDGLGLWIVCPIDDAYDRFGFTEAAKKPAGLGCKRPLLGHEISKSGRADQEMLRGETSPPSYRNTIPNLASLMPVACLSIARNTGSKSPGEELMILEDPGSGRFPLQRLF